MPPENVTAHRRIVGNGVAAFSFPFGCGGSGKQVGLVRRCRFRFIEQIERETLCSTVRLQFYDPIYHECQLAIT